MRCADGRIANRSDRSLCRRLIQTGSRSFFTASLLLPPSVREAAYALYAFCRLSDDMVDVDGGSHASIDQLRERLDRAYAGRPANSAVDRAFADVISGYCLPRALPEALIDGLAWDVAGVRCDTLADLYAYSVRVAGSVGAMMSVLMGVTDVKAVSRACDLGIAMQLTNVARDVGEDARAGRLYLPRSWLKADGLDPEDWLAHPVPLPAIRTAVVRLLETAESLYENANKGITHLPAACRPAIFAASHIYREIGMEILRHDGDSVSGRAHVSGTRKLQLMGRAMMDAAATRRQEIVMPCLAEASYLVEAISARPSTPAEPPLGQVARRIIWVAELFASLEARTH